MILDPRTRAVAGRGALVAAALLLAATPAPAHPEFQRSIVARTHRSVNCAYCHTSADGPEGTAPGQIGRLTASEIEQLGRARAALLPGAGARNPILNAFGNHVLNAVGKARILELRLVPEQLGAALPTTSDLDHDGISDVQELRDGTHPLIDSDGDPRRLFVHRLRHNLTPLVLALCATVLGLYGLRHLLLGFEIALRVPVDTDNADTQVGREHDA